MQLALIFLCILGLVMLLGLSSISLLHNVNNLSVAVADEWLPTTSAIGDLNNYTSDFRAVEGSYLLAASKDEVAAVIDEMAGLSRSVGEAEKRFESIRHDPADSVLYRQWKDKWAKYQEMIANQRRLVESGHTAEAVAAYMSSSRAIYNESSRMLDTLTEHVVASAKAAKDRLSGGYSASLSLIWFIIIVVAGIIAAALLYIRSLISLPLRRLTDCMHRLALNDIDVQIPGTRWKNEIGEMARAAVVFRRHAIDLMRSRSILASEASTLEERLAQEQRLVANQRNFVSMASHEFRTPLTIIDAHARRLSKMRTPVNASEVVDRASRIRAAVSRITHGIDNLLTTSRVIDGVLPELSNSEIDLRQLLAEVAQLHREMDSRAKIIEHYEGDDLKVKGDQTLLFYVFSNILGNAIKYSPDAGPIHIEAMPADAGVKVSIRDHGIGIPEGDRHHLFERFRRGSNVGSIVGTGVGLSLAKTVLDSHGGKIECTSEVGEGSCFTIWMPRPIPSRSES